MIGGGVSGRDLVNHLSKTVSRVTLSQHKIPNKTTEILKSYSSRVTYRENVKRFTLNGAEFMDGSSQSFDVVIYATGETLKRFNKNNLFDLSQDFFQATIIHSRF